MAETWLSVADIQHIQGWTREQIYWYARRDNWHRTKTRPRYYWWQSVASTAEKESNTRVNAA